MARDKLAEGLAKYQGSAHATVERVLSEVPKDSLVRGESLRFSSDGVSLRMAAGTDGTWALHRHALGQVAERAEVPMAFASRLLAGASWEQDMLADVLSRTYAHEEKSRFLVRAVDGHARGFLSDKFRRLDSRPVLEAAIEGMQVHGAVPYEGRATDVRMWLRGIIPEPFEILPGEWVALGIAFSNSDYGAGAIDISAFLLRLICLNGATTQDHFRQIHLGKRLGDSIAFSQATYALDTRTVVSAVRDVTGAALAPDARRLLQDNVRAAQARTIDPKSLPTLLKSLSKDELTHVHDAFTGPDVMNLPPEPTAWRLANALSWTCHKITQPDRKADLERLAGSMLRAA